MPPRRIESDEITRRPPALAVPYRVGYFYILSLANPIGPTPPMAITAELTSTRPES